MSSFSAAKTSTVKPNSDYKKSYAPFPIHKDIISTSYSRVTPPAPKKSSAGIAPPRRPPPSY